MQLIFTLPSPAKINRFMRIVRRRADNMHELQTLFQFIDLCDYISFYNLPDNQVKTNLYTIDGTENIILKVANLLKKFKNPLGVLAGVYIELKKNIPIGAGLGGGSSNAATCLLALNHIWNLKLSLEELAKLGLQLGADVPIFLYGKAAYAEGVGEIIKPVANIDEPKLLLVYPGKPTNTAEVFRHKDLNRDNEKIDFTNHSWKSVPVFNDSFALVKSINSSVAYADKWLEKFGKVQMSGTGSTLFMELKGEMKAEEILAKMPEYFAGFKAKAFITKTVNQSPLKMALNKYF